MQTYKLKNLPFFQEARAALEKKCDCPHCTCNCEHCKKKIKQAENAGEYFKKLKKIEKISKKVTTPEKIIINFKIALIVVLIPRIS